MALVGGWRWDRRQRRFVPFATMEGATKGVCVSFQRRPLHSSQVQAFLTHRVWGYGREVVSDGQVKGDGAGPVQAWHNKWSAQGKYFRKLPLTLDLVGEDRSGPVGRDSAASPAVRGVQWQPGCGAQPHFPGMELPRCGFSGARGPCGPVPCRAVAIAARFRGRAQCGAGGGEPRDIFECEAEPEHFMNGLI